MIFDVGYLILITALVISVFGIVVGFWGGKQRNTKLMASSFQRRLRRRLSWSSPRRRFCGTACWATTLS